jgi:hypothetical protein
LKIPKARDKNRNRKQTTGVFYRSFGKKNLIREELKEQFQNYLRASWKKRGEK